MIVADLLAKLIALYPASYAGDKSIAAWTGVFRDTLARFEGPALQRAFDNTMASWNKTTSPRPGDIAPHCIAERAGATTSTGPLPDRLNMRKLSDFLQHERPRIVDEWWMNNQDLIAWIMASIPTDQHASTRWAMRCTLLDKAHDAAQHRYFDHAQGRDIILTQGEADTIIRLAIDRFSAPPDTSRNTISQAARAIIAQSLTHPPIDAQPLTPEPQADIPITGIDQNTISAH